MSKLVAHPFITLTDTGYNCAQSDCLLCDRHIERVWYQGNKVHRLADGDIVNCMQDTHLSSRSVN